MAAEKKTGKRNVLDKETGFHVMVNLYIMRYIYSHTKNKANRLSEYERQVLDLRDEDFYKVIGTGRQRMCRILHGERFEMTEESVDLLVERFCLGREYFDKVGRSNGNGGTIKKGKIIQVSSLTEEDWRGFFEEKYNVFGKDKSDEDKKRADTVKRELTKLMWNDTIDKSYAKDSEVSKIHFFYKQGQPYRDETQLMKFQKALEGMKLSDWIGIEDNPEEMEKYTKLLRRHLQYLRIVTEYQNIKKEMENE